MPLAPLMFHPIFRPMPWGGRRLPDFLRRPAPLPDPVGEAWVLSDVDGQPSRVADGPLAGRTLRELVAGYGPRLLGRAPAPNGRFPLLLKFIDARQELSVQVHPSDEQARARVPAASGKTEAWVILDADPTTSRIYAGFKAGVGEAEFRAALANGTAPDTLHRFTPSAGDCVYLPAGTVHAIGADILLFEVQQTSDTTYRLYDWDRVDKITGKGRDLHLDDGLGCSDFRTGPCHPVVPENNGSARRQKLVRCPHFSLYRHTISEPTAVGSAGECVAVVGVGGSGRIAGRPFGVGDVVLIPAEVGRCELVPDGGPVTVLECGMPV